MIFSYMQSTKNMSSQLLRICKNNENMTFSNTQLTKKHDIIIIFMTS